MAPPRPGGDLLAVTVTVAGKVADGTLKIKYADPVLDSVDPQAGLPTVGSQE